MTTTYLTIDDAPSAALSEKVDLLTEEGISALLFCEGRRLSDHGAHARRAVEAGFHLGNHAYSHTNASALSVEAFRDELERTEERIDAVYDAAGVTRPARVFRFPYGDRGEDASDAHVEALQNVLADLDFSPMAHDTRRTDEDATWAASGRDWGWTLDTRDWDCETAADLRVQLDVIGDRLAVDGNSDGDEVVLFHDAGTDLALYEVLVEFLRDAGVRFGDPLDLVEA